MTGIARPVADISPYTRADAAGLAATEYAQMFDTLDALRSEEWSLPTDCEGWDVRALAGHVLGGTEFVCSVSQFAHQLRAGRAAAQGRPLVDGMTEVQVRERADLSTGEIVARFAAAGPRAARARARLPRPLRLIPMTSRVGDRDEKWRLGYLFDVILTRDTWMHRVDLCRATGREMRLTAHHDGSIVADVVREWSARHGRPFILDLTGLAGGHYCSPPPEDADERITMDAVEFCRVLSGRGAAGTGLLAQPVPF